MKEIKIKITEPNEDFVSVVLTIFTMLLLAGLSTFEIIPSWVFWVWMVSFFPIYFISKLRIKIK